MARQIHRRDRAERTVPRDGTGEAVRRHAYTHPALDDRQELASADRQQCAERRGPVDPVRRIGNLVRRSARRWRHAKRRA